MDFGPNVTALWPSDDYGHGKALCIEFANTLSWRGRKSPDELLPDAKTWMSWLRDNSALPSGVQAALEERLGQQPEEAAAALERAIALRESIYNLLSAYSTGEVPSPKDRMALQSVLSRALSELRFTYGDGAWGLKLDPSATWEFALFPPALSAAQLLTGPYGKRIRYCGRDECRWLFLDLTKNHSRKWCDMSSCGNVVKARTRYARRKLHAH